MLNLAPGGRPGTPGDHQHREDAVTRQSDTPARSSRRHISPRLVIAAILVVLAVVFIFQNSQSTQLRILIPVVTMPLWTALASMLIVGFAIGYALNWRRREPKRPG